MSCRLLGAYRELELGCLASSRTESSTTTDSCILRASVIIVLNQSRVVLYGIYLSALSTQIYYPSGSPPINLLELMFYCELHTPYIARAEGDGVGESF